MKQLKLSIPRADLFFTCWALVAHLLCLMGVFYNTTSLAIFVCIGAEIINLTINEEFNLTYHLLAHYLPLAVLLLTVPFRLDPRPIIILIVLYAVYLQFDFASMLRNYRRAGTYAFNNPFVVTFR